MTSQLGGMEFGYFPPLLHSEEITIDQRELYLLINIGPSSDYYVTNDTCYLHHYLVNYHKLGLEQLVTPRKNYKTRRRMIALFCPAKNHQRCHGRVLQYVLAVRGKRSRNMWRHIPQNIFGEENSLLGMHSKFHFAPSHFHSVFHAMCFFAVKFAYSPQNPDFSKVILLVQNVKNIHGVFQKISLDNLCNYGIEKQICVLYTLLQLRWKRDYAFRQELLKFPLHIYDDPSPSLGANGFNLYGWLLTILRWSNGQYPCTSTMNFILWTCLLSCEGIVKQKNIAGLMMASSIVASGKITRILDRMINPARGASANDEDGDGNGLLRCGMRRNNFLR